MQHNPYSPPKAPLADPPRPPGSPVKAVLVGFAVDIVGTLVAGILLALGYAVYLAQQGATDAQIADAMTRVTPGSGLYSVAQLVGCGFSFLGGYVCARIARRSEYRLGCILAFLSILAGLAISDDLASWQGVLQIVTTAACVLLGTKYGRSGNAG